MGVNHGGARGDSEVRDLFLSTVFVLNENRLSDGVGVCSCRASGEKDMICMHGNGYKMAEVCPCRASGFDEIWVLDTWVWVR